MKQIARRFFAHRRILRPPGYREALSRLVGIYHLRVDCDQRREPSLRYLTGACTATICALENIQAAVVLDSSLLPRVEDVKDYVLRYVTVHDAVGAGLSRNDRSWRHAGKAAARPRRALVELHVPRDVTCTVVDCIAPQSRARLDEDDRKAARRLVPLSLKDGLETLDVTVRAGRAADDAASRAPSMMACLS